MNMVNFARKIAKIILFVGLFFLFASLVNSSHFISLDTANDFATWLHGNANQENYDDLWFFTDVISSLFFSVITYKILMKLINKLYPAS